MNNEIEKIFKEQIEKLPIEVVDYISSSKWDADADEIGSLYDLTERELSLFTREVSFVLAGLIHPSEFYFALEGLGFKGETLDALVANVEKKIFTPIRPALIKFFEEETEASTENTPQENTSLQPSELTPANLPTEETVESFLPKLTPKVITPAPTGHESLHPFEEKMKESSVVRQQTVVTPQKEASVPQTPAMQTPKNPPVYQADPYREPIE